LVLSKKIKYNKTFGTDVASHAAQMVVILQEIVSIIKVRNNMKLECVKYLRKDFVETSIILKYEKNEIIEAYLQNYELGSIELKDNVLLVHKWENEDQVKSVSEISKRYPCILSNGIESNKSTQNEILKRVEDMMEQKIIEKEVYEIFRKCLELIKLKLEIQKY